MDFHVDTVLGRCGSLPSSWLLSPARILGLMLICAVLFRASTLEINALIDPTESRYASVAQEMVLGSDWVTPKLPMPAGVEPYLGKPPLHFWMTAIAYSLFGMDEWTSRLPSFLAMLGVVALMIAFSRRFLSLEVGLGGAGILLSSAIFFFLAGASAVDVTLTATLSLGVVGFAFGLQSTGRARYLYGAMATIGAALGFLTKGPVAIALLGTTLIFFSLFRRDVRGLKNFPWLSSAALFAVIVLPWFLWAELRTPGFIKYFVWNENIGRYLFKEYGDLYGSGHRHPRGFVWVMLILAFLPWTPLLLQQAWQQRRQLLSEPRALLLAWGLSAAVFFSLVRQLHIGYVLPSLPPLALLLADLLRVPALHQQELHDADSSEVRVESLSRGTRYLRWTSLCATVVSALALAWIVLSVFTRSLPHLVLPMVVLVAGALLLCAMWNTAKQDARKLRRGLYGAPALLALMYASGLVAITPQLDRSTSTEEILMVMANSIPETNPEIGIVTRNTFSHYWLSRMGDSELTRPVRITFLDPSDVQTVRHVLVKRKDFSRLPDGVQDTYQEQKTIGDWVWLEKSEPGTPEASHP